jgi:endonuclease YncB( thermonuclease family)
MVLPFPVLTLFLIPTSALAADFNNVTYHHCYDDDIYNFTLPDVHPLFGDKIGVRIAGIDTPEIRGKLRE